MNAPLSRTQIKSAGVYLPERVVTNHDLESLVQTTDEWIVTRTGIKERRIASQDETAVEMGYRAGKHALENAGLAIEDIDLIIASTISPDHIFPSTACSIQGRFESKRKDVPCFDVQAACTGFVYAMVTAEQFLRAGAAKNVLLVGAERLSSIVDWNDRSTCVLFGDGAGAMVLTQGEDRGKIIDFDLGSFGQQGKILYFDHFNSQLSYADSAKGVSPDHRLTCLQMSGKEVFKQAVTEMEKSARKLLERQDLGIEDIRCVITHQANYRIIDALASRLKVPEDKCFVNLDRYGNISTACIPVAMYEAMEKYQFKPGDKILLVAFGGGLTWGSILVEW